MKLIMMPIHSTKTKYQSKDKFVFEMGYIDDTIWFRLYDKKMIDGFGTWLVNPYFWAEFWIRYGEYKHAG